MDYFPVKLIFEVCFYKSISRVKTFNFFSLLFFFENTLRKDKMRNDLFCLNNYPLKVHKESFWQKENEKREKKVFKNTSREESFWQKENEKRERKKYSRILYINNHFDKKRGKISKSTFHKWSFRQKERERKYSREFSMNDYLDKIKEEEKLIMS